MLDFKKFLFDEKQKLKKSKKGGRKIKQREFRFGPNIGENDLKQRIKRAEGFLKKKDRVKFTIYMRGRENTHPEIAYDKLSNIVSSLSEVGKEEEPAKRIGKQISVIIVPS